MIYLPSNSLLRATITPKTHLISNLLTYLEYPKFRFLLTFCSHHTRGRGKGKHHKGLLFFKKIQFYGLKFLPFPVTFTGQWIQGRGNQLTPSLQCHTERQVTHLFSGGQFQKGTELVAFFRETGDPFSAWANLS